MRAFPLILAAALCTLAACDQPQRPAAPQALPPEPTPVLTTGCYRGHQTNSADTIELRIQQSAADALSGTLRIAIREKDQRAGTLEAIRGADGVYRAIFSFMQEGMRDSVRVQFRVASGTVLEMRPQAYDAATGREYPDSSKPFSIRLEQVACADAVADQAAAAR